MSVTVSKTAYKNFGECIKVSNGEIELFATIDIGPRIIRFAEVDGENIMFEDIGRDVSVDISSYNYFESGSWYIYGGHRLWISPEDMPASYYSDNHKVEYEIINNGVILRQRTQEFLNIALEMKIVMVENGEVFITHKITNKSGFDITLAPWALTVLTKGGREAVPMTDKDTGLLGNRILALWPYSDMGDKRIKWGKKYAVLSQDKNAQTAFKFGSTNDDGYAAYFVHDYMFLKQYTHVEGGNYPDFGVSFETYTNNHFLEMETLGQLKTLKPSESTTHGENWKLILNVSDPCDSEEEIAKTIKRHL